jgi:iron complex transport system substrate-binding protein
VNDLQSGKRRLIRIDWLNASAVSLALALAVAAATAPTPGKQARRSDGFAVTARTELEPLGDGRVGLRDATGTRVELSEFRRIASGSLVADGLLEGLCERDRLVAFSAHADEDSPLRYRFAGKPTVPFDLSVERMLELRPDLFVFNGISQRAKVEQLRRAGVQVFDLGEMRGLGTLLQNARSVGALIGDAERGERFARAFERRMRSIGERIAPAERRGALYLGMHGDQLFGGGRDTSYHDVIESAGLIDVAAPHYEGWPKYTPEQVLALAPEVVVTQDGVREHLCEVFGLSSLPACGPSGLVVGLSPALLVNPGVAMLDAAEALHRAVYQSQDALAYEARP